MIANRVRGKRSSPPTPQWHEQLCNMKGVLKQDKSFKRRDSAFIRYPKSRADVSMTARRSMFDTDRGTDRRWPDAAGK
jgi:hypothetical protein